ncbi:hypothetical protein SAMN04488543_4098 [Friedmanniella luteola]|uniref:Uncharacterized protein n=1 Tax=Friedmanniella luteola TaxID=546871 RepID=A0A1H1ZYF9_9ACTN|nr:hypothetical protein [Friedmanniella luteola]SDT38831.1 hypothetical protein SAMN04488543_4098 [Friedmanniella luteola]
MDLDDAAEELYAGSPDDFVERRTALVAQARAARDRPLAREIAALRRPTRTAWLLNRLARDDAGGITALLELAAELEDAQRRRSGPDLRRLSAERRRRVDQLARDAVRRGAAAGYAAAESALQEVGQSLQSALGDPATAELLRRGRLTTAVSYGGFGSTDLMAAMAASMPTAAPGPETGAEPEPGSGAGGEAEAEPEPEDEERRARERRAAEAEDRWVQAAAALADREQEAEEATARADALADRVEELQTELARAEADEAAARSEARDARRRHQGATRAAAEAERARDEARAALER